MIKNSKIYVRSISQFFCHHYTFECFLSLQCLSELVIPLLDETRKILHEQECERTLVALLTNEVIKLLSVLWFESSWKHKNECIFYLCI